MEFNIKNIEVRDPINLYNELDKYIRFGDDHATVKSRKDEIDGYFVGGLLVEDLKRSSISSETISQLYSALKSQDIKYAILPDDVRKGQIPLILDDHTRSYFRNHLQELTETHGLAWRMFFIPIKELQTDDELFSAEILKEENDENVNISISYEEVEEYLNKILDKESADIDFSSIQDTLQESSQADEKNIDSSNNYRPDNDIDNLSFTEEDEDEEDELDGQTANEKHEDVNSDENKEIADDDNFEEKEQTNDISDSVDKENGDFEVSKDNEFTVIPQELESILNNFKLRRFEPFENLDENDTTHIALQKEIKNANNIIEEYENNVYRKGKQLYVMYMQQSEEKINQVIDAETGDEKVKSKYNETSEQQNELDDLLVKNIDTKKEELEHKFWNDDFKIYKEQTLAGLKLQFEKEEYYNLVVEPLERYEESEKAKIEEQKLEKSYALSNWIEAIKDQAIMSDRNNAIIEVQKYLDDQMKKVQEEVQKINKNISDQNEEFVKYEMSKKAEERLRNTVGSDLYTDEEAKKFKKQFEIMEQKKEELTEKVKQLKTKYEIDIESKDDEFNKYKEDIEKNHKDVVDEKDKELTELNKEVEELKTVNDKNKSKLDNNEKQARKKMLTTGVGAFVVSALIFGGTAFGIHSQNKDVAEKLDKQSEIVKQQKKEVNEHKDEIKSLEESKKKDHDKQQEIIDKQKKELKDKDKKKK